MVYEFYTYGVAGVMALFLVVLAVAALFTRNS
jgi:hypothetical protein